MHCELSRVTTKIRNVKMHYELSRVTTKIRNVRCTVSYPGVTTKIRNVKMCHSAKSLSEIFSGRHFATKCHIRRMTRAS